MSQDLVGELRELAQRATDGCGALRAQVTRDFWRLAGQLRAALPPLLLPYRTGSARVRIGYLVATRGRVNENLAELSGEHDAGSEDVWLYLLGGVKHSLTVGWARTADLSNLTALQAARLIAEADLDALIDIDGAALTAMPFLIALCPARAIIEPLFEPACPAAAGSQSAAQGAATGLAQMARLARAAAANRPGQSSQPLDSPAELNGRLDRAIRMHQAGELEAAHVAYESVLMRYPEHPVAAYLLGQLSHQQGKSGEAILRLQLAASAAPEFRDAHYTLGQRLVDSRRWSEAASAYRRSVELTPGFAAGWSGLGLATQHDPGTAGRTAIGYLERAVALEPDVAQWRFNLGAALQRGGELVAARQVYEQLLAHGPDSVEAWFNLGAVAQEQVDYPAAIAAYRAALQQQPRFAPPYSQLGACLQLTGQIEAWLENFRRYRENCPESLPMATYGLEASMADGDPVAHADWRERILAGEFPAADPEEFTRNWEQLFFLLLHVDLDRETLHQWYQRYDDAASAVYGAPEALPGTRRPGRTRIGYLSGDLREHVMGRMIYDWVSRHDASRYDIFLYSLSSARDAWTARFQALGLPLVELWSLPHDAAASRIRQDDIDLLIDCSGHTRGAQPGILARKPARVIATHIATPGPIGLRAIDFKLTEPLAESNDAQQFVLERLLAVPGGVFPWRRYPAPGALHRSALGLTPGAFVCGAFVSLMKLSPRCLNLWCRLLARLPHAVLAFSPTQASWQPAYRRWLQAHGIGGDRVVFVPCPPDEAGQLARYHVLDVALDPLPCGNVNGTMEAVSMGVPVVTLVGPRHGERLGNALLSRFGVTATIARNEEEYVRIVERLACERPWSAQVRSLIAQRLVDSPVWDADAYVRGLEAAYDRMLAERGVAVE
jgi:predicted O-linked N-acetylglucosamine transferase (SPINDLY family)